MFLKSILHMKIQWRCPEKGIGIGNVVGGVVSGEGMLPSTDKIEVNAESAPSNPIPSSSPTHQQQYSVQAANSSHKNPIYSRTPRPSIHSLVQTVHRSRRPCKGRSMPGLKRRPCR